MLTQEKIYGTLKEGEPAGDFDNLYVDMNGLIHPAAHPTTGPSPKSEEEMLVRIMTYLDRLMAVIQPKNVLYLSIDGSAPRAKLNQQRGRRFKAVIDRGKSLLVSETLEKQAKSILKDLQSEYKEIGKVNLNPSNPSWDHNVITPGTPFMEKVSKTVMYYVIKRMNEDSRWKNLTVIVSDSSVPGEGEQKIFDYVRDMRQHPSYDPNTSHVIHGLDADLVMLSLLTYEHNFFILREDVFDHERPDLDKPLGLFQLSPLRTCLHNSFSELIDDLEMNLDRVIGDFVFLIYLMGNDFVPHLPAFEISSGIEQVAIEYIRYMKGTPKTERQYFTAPGIVNIPRLLDFIKQRLVPIENESLETQFSKWNSVSDKKPPKDYSEMNSTKAVKITHDTVKFMFESWKESQKGEKKRNISDVFKEMLQQKKDLTLNNAFPQPKNVYLPSDISNRGKNWENKYYRVKFRKPEATDEEILDLRRDVALEYLKGLIWVWKYYSQNDTASWNWFFPYHFGPFCFDFDLLTEKDLRKVLEFHYDKPLLPFDQLMSVLPPASSHALPKPYAKELTDSQDLEDFYPTRFEIDLDGHHPTRQQFKAVPLLPFIDSKRLIAKTKKLEKYLTEDERTRNTFGHPLIFFHKKDSELSSVFKKSTKKVSKYLLPQSKEIQEFLDDEKSKFGSHNGKIFGHLFHLADKHPMNRYVVPVGSTLKSPLKNFSDIKNKSVMMAAYMLPSHSVECFGTHPKWFPPKSLIDMKWKDNNYGKKKRGMHQIQNRSNSKKRKRDDEPEKRKRRKWSNEQNEAVAKEHKRELERSDNTGERGGSKYSLSKKHASKKHASKKHASKKHASKKHSLPKKHSKHSKKNSSKLS